MSKNAVYWLWLQKALGEGAFFKEIIKNFGGVKALYDSNILEWKMSPALVSKQISRLEKAKISDAENMARLCERNGWQIIDYDDDRYPQRLREIVNPPAVLYVDGELPDIDSRVVLGIVGTRRASEYAVKVTGLMSGGVARCGAVVVSGGALGVDSAAHRGALSVNGKTVAVLGCGFGTNYLAANRPLRNAIKNGGALVTEFPPFTPATKYTFPLRNRLISALSLGVLVVEAGVKSGSLITAEFALEQGRDVFAVPCSILSPDYAGTNKLIEDGATIALKPADLLFPYAERFKIDMSKVKTVNELMEETADKNANIAGTAEDKLSFERLEEGRQKIEKREKALLGLSESCKTVYGVLTESFQHIDIITEKCAMPVSAVLSALTALEIADLAQSAGGKRYKRS